MRFNSSSSRCLMYLTAIIAALLPFPSFSFYDNSENVLTFTDFTDFASNIRGDDSIWMMQFYSTSDADSKQYTPVWEGIATILKGVVKVGAIDFSSEKFKEGLNSVYGIKGPSILFFGSDKTQYKPHKGDTDPQTLINAVLQTIVNQVEKRASAQFGGGPNTGASGGGGSGGEKHSTSSDSGAVSLDGSTFGKIYESKEIWMVAFVAPWCGHCKNLLPEWHSAASALKGSGANLAVVDATQEESLASQFGVRGFPTIKVFPGGDKSGPGDAIDYMGGRTEDQILQYTLEEVERSGVPKEIPEMTSLDVLKENCDVSKKVCILTALPHILESMAAGRNKYLETLKAAQKATKSPRIEFLWYEGGSFQTKLEQSLELTFGFPAVVALSMEKSVYAVMRGSFTEKSIKKFVNSILSGKASTVKFDTLPSIETVEPWDGEDGVPFEEEPFDLDDLLSDEF